MTKRSIPLLGVVTPLPKLTGCAAEKGTFLNIDFRTKGCDIKRPSVQKSVHKGQCQKKMKNEKINKMNQGISRKNQGRRFKIPYKWVSF